MFQLLMQNWINKLVLQRRQLTWFLIVDFEQNHSSHSNRNYRDEKVLMLMISLACIRHVSG